MLRSRAVMTSISLDRPADAPPERVTIPLRSDPPWLGVGVALVTLLCILVFMVYFKLRHQGPLGLAVIPGLALGTFASAYLAWWGRRRGGTMRLEAEGTSLVLEEPGRREELLDRAMPFGAMLVVDRVSGRRVVVLSQNTDPVMVLDMRRAPAPLSGPWAARTLTLDLSQVALSPATAHVLTVRDADTLDPLLGVLQPDLGSETPLLMCPMPSGETLIVTREEVRAGRRVWRVGEGTIARRITVQIATGEVTGLSLLRGDASLLLASIDPSEVPEGRASTSAPDCYLPALVFAAVASLFGIEAAPASATARAYRG